MKKIGVENITLMAKKYVTRKVLLGAGALVSGVAMIILFTFVPYTWDPSRLLSSEFLTDSLIIAAITILGMVCWIFISQATNANNPASKVSQSMVAFRDTKERISDKHAFKQWIKLVQQPKDLADIKARIMMRVGVDDMSVLKLSESEIKSLLGKAQSYNGDFYQSLTKKQVKACLYVKSGIRVNFPVPEDYLSAKSILDDRTPSERLANEGSKKRNFATLSIASKLVFTILTMGVFTVFVRDLSSDMDGLAAAGKFSVRMMNLFTSSLMGYVVGGQLNDMDAEYVNLRVEVFEEYLSDRDFKPKSVKELAKEEFAERVKKENVLMLEG